MNTPKPGTGPATETPECTESPKEIVKLITTYYKSRKGYHYCKAIIPVRKKSQGFQVLEEDITMMSPEEVIRRITNLHSVKDGFYEVMICNEQTDWETGIVDSYDYVLCPYGPR